MAHIDIKTANGIRREYLPCQHPEAFVHSPRQYKYRGKMVNDWGGNIFTHPHATKALWDLIWETARAQEWYEADVGYISNCVENGQQVFYFTYPGQRTGLAKVVIDSPLIAESAARYPRQAMRKGTK